MPVTRHGPEAAPPRLVPGRDADEVAVAAMWSRAWHDGHRGRVPDALLAERGPEHFVSYLRQHESQATVAVDPARRPVGLVIVDGPGGEVVQLAVSSATRGSGCAARLLDVAERQIAAHHDLAWLAVVPANARARRFYERRGWRDRGPMTHHAPAGASTVAVPTIRYVKHLSGTTS